MKNHSLIGYTWTSIAEVLYLSQADSIVYRWHRDFPWTDPYIEPTGDTYKVWAQSKVYRREVT